MFIDPVAILKNHSSFRSEILTGDISLLKELNLILLRWFYKHHAPTGAKKMLLIPFAL